MSNPKEEYRIVALPVEELNEKQRSVAQLRTCCECGCTVGFNPSSLELLDGRKATPICRDCAVSQSDDAQMMMPTKKQILALIEEIPEEHLPKLLLTLAHWPTLGPLLMKKMQEAKKERTH